MLEQRDLIGGEDPALATALEVLDGLVCECGHVSSCHFSLDGDCECEGECGEPCACSQFRDVDFFVTRASVREPQR